MTDQLLQAFTDSVPEHANEIRLFSVMRNEAQRVPYFLKYYVEEGVDRFFIVDNDSTDGTTDLLKSGSNVHVFRTSNSYSASRCGTDWLETLLADYGVGHWCIIADADEFLVYPCHEQASLPQLCKYLDSEQVSAFPCLLVDMYSNRPFDETDCVPGTDPLSACPFFESESILCVGSPKQVQMGKWSHWGGMRRRLFNLNPCLDKIVLIKYVSTIKLYPGMHGVSGANVSQMRGASLHFKYLADFSFRAAREARRGEHWNDAYEYRAYSQMTARNRQLCAYGPLSQRLSGSTDLINAGIMSRPDGFISWLSVDRSGLSPASNSCHQEE